MTWSQNLFPETRIVRFNRRQDRLLFFSIVDELVEPAAVVVDFGAGRNRHGEYGPHIERTSTLRGRCARVIGIDVDPIVQTNDSLDEAFVIGDDGRLPLADHSVDLMFSYAVAEHLANPSAVVSEIDRVLKPGGWFCAWTPNKWGYVGIGARLVPNRLHASLIQHVQPGSRAGHDVFPTQYRMNSRKDIRRLFPADAYDDFSFVYNAQPSYNFGRELVARWWLLYMAATPKFLGQSLMIFVRKR